MLNLVLFEPEIPPNTGNIMRLCANTGALLHLIEPLGFTLDEKRLRRAGLDYRDEAVVRSHKNWNEFLTEHRGRIWPFSTKGQQLHTEVSYLAGDALLLGPETRGLPEHILSHPRVQPALRLPMRPDSRSLNLSNSAAVATYEALRQLGFPNLS
jgi:tRNA (cytidine/uridine-2'-O-)-methyltransferase